jgi:hypothetical protein
MKKYCIYCGKAIEEKTDICPSCKKNNSFVNKSEDDIHVLHQYSHRGIQHNSDLRNNALCFIIIGLILLVIGSLFLLLSFKYNVIKQRIFSPLSLEFFVCVACLGTSLGCLIFGFIRLVDALSHIKYYGKYIKDSEEANKN